MTESRSANLRRKVLAHWSRIESSGSVIDPMPRTRHFGATLSWPEWESFVERLVDPALIVEPATLSYIGEPIEQGKLMIVYPSGNLIEIKAYRNPAAVLGPLAEQ